MPRPVGRGRTAATSYDAGLLERCLDALAGLPVRGVRHRSVFGMRGLLVGSRMFAAVGDEGLVVRLSPGEYDDALRRRGVRPFAPGGERLGRWVRLGAAHVADDPELRDWLEAGLRSLHD